MRILNPSESEWHDELATVSYYGESHFERMVMQHVESLFPDYKVFPFKKGITSDQGITKCPDLCMIRKDLGEWYVVEVEIDGHELGHVVDQVTCFAYGEYNTQSVTDYIFNKLSEYELSPPPKTEIYKLISDNAPKILVIVDTVKQDWLETLSDIPAELCVIEVYKSPKGRHLYRIGGQYPITVVSQAQVRRHKTLPNVFEIVGHLDLSAYTDSNIDISFQDRLTRWKVIKDQRGVYLRFLGKMNPLSPASTYRVFCSSQGRYVLEAN